jgi:hypothetical protein
MMDSLKKEIKGKLRNIGKLIKLSLMESISQLWHLRSDSDNTGALLSIKIYATPTRFSCKGVIGL